MNGLTAINIEFTSRCNKSCWMCGRRKVDRDFPEKATSYGDMPIEMVESISKQVPEGIVVQFHNNGEPLLYPRLKEALGLFPHCIRQLDTNGKLLLEKAEDLIGNLDVLTVSVIQDDTHFDRYLQWESVTGFLKIKGDQKPRMVYRCLGEVDTLSWKCLQGMVVTRTLHDAMGSFNYKKPVTIPEIGICDNFLTRLSIDRFGNVSPCPRFDPHGLGIIGNINDQSLEEIWDSDVRQFQKRMHILGSRDLLPLCSQCDYWGVPIGGV